MFIAFIINVIINSFLFYVLLNIGDWEKRKAAKKAKEREIQRISRFTYDEISRYN